MYQQVETDKEIKWEESIVNPVATLADEYGGRMQIVVDDHCFVLLIKWIDLQSETKELTYCPSAWWNREAIEVLKTLPTTLLD
jgi:hypothetical protein